MQCLICKCGAFLFCEAVVLGTWICGEIGAYDGLGMWERLATIEVTSALGCGMPRPYLSFIYRGG